MKLHIYVLVPLHGQNAPTQLAINHCYYSQMSVPPKEKTSFDQWFSYIEAIIGSLVPKDCSILVVWLIHQPMMY